MKIIDSAGSSFRFCPKCGGGLTWKTIEGRRRHVCPKDGFVWWRNPKPVVSGEVMLKGKVLMVQRAYEPLKGYWCLPGGFMEYEETPEEALRREFREEVGAEMVIDGLVGVYRIDNDPRGVHIDIIYAGRLKGEIELCRELCRFEYFDRDNIPEKVAYKHRQAIADFVI